MKFRYWVILLVIMLISLTACGKTDENANEILSPTYGKNTSVYHLVNDANPYAIRYCDSGFVYYVSDVKVIEEDPEDADTSEDTVSYDEYTFFYQAYASHESTEYCVLSECYVRNFAIDLHNGDVKLAVLIDGTDAGLLVFDGIGKPSTKINIDSTFLNLNEIPELIIVEDGYVISLSDGTYLLNADGSIASKIIMNDRVQKLYTSDNGNVYAVLEKNENGSTKQRIAQLDFSKKQAVEVCELSQDVLSTFSYIEEYVCVTKEYITKYQYSDNVQECLVDLEKQGLVGAQIQYFYGEGDKLRIISMDPYSSEGDVYMFELYLLGDEEVTQTDEALLSSDGRRIVKVAIPNSCAFQVEFHAQQYNQISDDSFIEVERFDGTLEDYLGKGSRPDVIMFNDNTEIDDYVQKGLLVNLLPLIEGSESISSDDLLPKAVELLGGEDGASMYAVSSRFQLLLRTTDGSELVEDKCDSIEYLNWYNGFMSSNHYNGFGKMENILYANVPLYYDADSAQAGFNSAEFKALLEAYKSVWENNQGIVALSEVSEKDIEIANGPKWCATYRNYALAEPGVYLSGIPGTDGKNYVYMRLCEPMSILETSECKEYAFEFIAYYTSLFEPLMKGESTADYHKSGNTMALFSTYEEVLRLGIYESEKPYCTLSGYGEVYFTEEQKTELQNLIDSAVADTKEQRDIYNILMEELDSYLQGAKSLDEVCEIIQSRATIYLSE